MNFDSKWNYIRQNSETKSSVEHEEQDQGEIIVSQTSLKRNCSPIVISNKELYCRLSLRMLESFQLFIFKNDVFQPTFW